MSEKVYINAYKGSQDPKNEKAPKVKAKVSKYQLDQINKAFPEGFDIAIFKNPKAGQIKNVKGKEYTESDYNIIVQEPYKKSPGGYNNKSDGNRQQYSGGGRNSAPPDDDF